MSVGPAGRLAANANEVKRIGAEVRRSWASLEGVVAGQVRTRGTDERVEPLARSITELAQLIDDAAQRVAPLLAQLEV